MVFVKVDNVLVFELAFWRNGSVIELLLVRFQSAEISDLIKKLITYSLIECVNICLNHGHAATPEKLQGISYAVITKIGR